MVLVLAYNPNYRIYLFYYSVQGSRLYNEQETLQSLASGSETAFSLIHAHYGPLIYREAYRYLRSSDLAKDVVQEIFTTVWARRETFVSVEHLQGYLVVMGKNLAYQFLVKLSKERLVHKEFSMSLEDEESLARREAYRSDLQKMLETTIEKLPQQQKHVFRLAKLRGMSYNTIAKTLNISPNTVKNHIIAANNYIKKQLQHSSILGILLLFLF